ncbi:DUF6064 family protein [Polaromonas aquatica]|uniref:DUF6064 family protein n=1 Tax=Polaromonas aquatica TaxID=332657 RepID=UPI003D65A611
MSEWWTYRLSDFLMFSPRTYWRLMELYNRDFWPLHVATLLAGIAALGLAASRNAVAQRVMVILLAATWLWVGWAFHWQRYATINWAAQYVALAFAAQAVLLLGLGLQRHREAVANANWRLAGWLLASAGVLYPLAAPLAGRPWAQAEVFGMAPEPTALLTLGVLMISHAPRQIRFLLLAGIPVASLLLGAATIWTFST